MTTFHSAAVGAMLLAAAAGSSAQAGPPRAPAPADANVTMTLITDSSATLPGQVTRQIVLPPTASAVAAEKSAKGLAQANAARAQGDGVEEPEAAAGAGHGAAPPAERPGAAPHLPDNASVAAARRDARDALGAGTQWLPAVPHPERPPQVTQPVVPAPVTPPGLGH